MSFQPQPLTITRIRDEAEEFKTFYFEGPDAAGIAYEAGQYLTFVGAGAAQEIRRSYSITSAPVLREPLAIGVKRVANGAFSRYLIDTVRPGDQLLTTGAAGLFTLPPTVEKYEQVFFLAAGSGITPIFALLKTVLYAHPALSAVLIYSNRTEEAAVFKDALDELLAEFPDRLRVEFLYSNHPNLARARLYKELLKSLVRQHARTTPARTLAYLCGPTDYMRMGLYGLREMAVPLENIRRENFNIDKVAIAQPQPPDIEAHTISIQLRERSYQLPVHYPQTILQAAKQQGISLPYSCEAGRCGSCVARCVAGTVWMSYNEVLTERDLAKGLILTCVGYPVGGDARLEIG